MNLAVNARDAMPDGGQLSITLKNASVDDALARQHGEVKPGHFVCITVSDTGVGMNAEVCDKIFDPFFTTKGPGKGTGLGLATVHTIVHDHGGFIQVASAPGKGTRFDVYLPACDEMGAAVTNVPFQAPPRGHDELILVADDEITIREIVKTTLEAYGYRTISADDGIDALSKFALHQKEIGGAVIDLKMPHLNGTSCIQAIRRIAGHLPILLVSGVSEAELPVAQIASLGTAFLQKPFSKSDLLDALHQCLVSSGPTVTAVNTISLPNG
jgi:CheY-like chemotaxis protein